MIEAYPCSTPVKTTIGNIDAVITGILIRQGRITYDIDYFLDGKYQQAHVDEFMFTTETKKQEIGFKQ